VNGETAKYIVKILNRWKLASVVRSSSSPHSEAQPPAMTDGSSDVAWQDGHVIDFGN
jgi:prepilin-type processing-associated H-X9-DG protein